MRTAITANPKARTATTRKAVQPVEPIFRWAPEVHHLLLIWLAGESPDADGTILPEA